jgi:hypothetical protein
MSHVEIVNMFEQDCFLVVQAEHYHDDGAFWFSEHYRWCGDEGLKQKRATDDQGRALLDDDSLAPTNTIDGEDVAYLPEGRDWKRHAAPHMDDFSIWETIVKDHNTRKAAGFGGSVNVLSRVTIPEDIATRLRSGMDTLLTRFNSVVGDAVVLE